MYAGRPVAILDLGWLKYKFGLEYQRITGQNVTDRTEITSKGFGTALQFVFNPYFEAGLNFAQGTVWNIDQLGKLNVQGSYTRTSYGAFANVSNGNPKHSVIFGTGSVMTQTEDQHPNGQDKYWLYQGFLAAQYVYRAQFFIKLVGGYSRGHWLTPPIAFDDEMYSVRVRFSYYF
jgi:hypothetical protein